MANFSYTYTLTNGTTADADQVTQNFTDVRNAIIDGTKDVTCAALTVNGNTVLGDASSDTITLNGRFASDLLPSTNAARDLGSTSLSFAELHLDNGVTDSGTIYFNGTATEYIQGNAAGTIVTIAGFPALEMTGTNLAAASAPQADAMYPNSMCKAWARIAAAGSVTLGFNVSSVTNTATGTYNVNFHTPLASSNWAGIATVEGTGAGGGKTVTLGSKTVSMCVAQVRDSTNALTDDVFMTVIFGTQ